MCFEPPAEHSVLKQNEEIKEKEQNRRTFGKTSHINKKEPYSSIWWPYRKDNYLLSSLTETTSPPSKEEKKEMEKLCNW